MGSNYNDFLEASKLHFTDDKNFDLRGRVRVLNMKGKPVSLYKPTKTIEACFEIETISWHFTGVEIRTGAVIEFKTASGTREREFRREHQGIYIFS